MHALLIFVNIVYFLYFSYFDFCLNDTSGLAIYFYYAIILKLCKAYPFPKGSL